MHIHGMQNNAAFALNALDAMQRAQAAQRAEETRKKLFEFASEIAGETEDCIVTLGEHQEDASRQQDRKHRHDGNTESGEDSTEPQISDWV